jgi:16S rRNA (adenine(1408)-N(1))-methyltransferase
VVVDLGTGDGRAVLERAAREPGSLVIGLDAAAAAMAEASRRADRGRRSNALFLAAGVEAIPGTPLSGSADLVTVTFPWGSLLRGALGLDDTALAGIAAALTPGGRLDVLASLRPTDGVEGLACLDASDATDIAARWSAAGLTLETYRPATHADVAASGSSWARRLLGGGRTAGETRTVWQLVGRRTG